jgi:hypothetical protein
MKYHKPSPRHIQKELDRLEATGEIFVLVDVAHRLNCTSSVLAFQLRQRENAKCLTPRNGKSGVGTYSQYKFIKKG